MQTKLRLPLLQSKPFSALEKAIICKINCFKCEFVSNKTKAVNDKLGSEKLHQKNTVSNCRCCDVCINKIK